MSSELVRMVTPGLQAHGAPRLIQENIMKYVKTLGLLAVAAAALMALAGTASATILTSPAGTTYTGSIVATSTNIEIDGPWVTIKCGHSKLEGDITSHGGAEVGSHIDSLTFTECNYPTTVKQAGTLGIDGSNTLKSTGIELSLATSIGTCVVTTNGSHFGVLTEGTPAVLDLNSAPLHRTAGNFLCGTWGNLTGTYTFTTPSTLLVD